MVCFLQDVHMSNALECTTAVLVIRMQRLCAMHAILEKLVFLFMQPQRVYGSSISLPFIAYLINIYSPSES